MTRLPPPSAVPSDHLARLKRLNGVGNELKASSQADTVAFAYGVGDEVLLWHDESDGRFFDLASLTKPLFTAPAVLLLAGGQPRLDSPIGDVVPGLPTRIAVLTARQLLTHAAGLPAELPVDLLPGRDGDETTDVVWDWLADDAPALAAPGELIVYSDPSYWVLGRLASELAGLPLRDVFAQAPTVLADEFSFGAAAAGHVVAAGPVRGRVQLSHDPATQRLGLSGHAGAFGTLRGVVHAVAAWLDGSWLPEPVAIGATTCQTHATPGGHRSLAWTLVGDPYHCVAHDWPTSTLCHTGFTGVCVALDPVSRWWGVYLSNAVPVERDARPVLKARRLFYAQAAEDLQTRTSLSSGTD